MAFPLVTCHSALFNQMWKTFAPIESLDTNVKYIEDNGALDLVHRNKTPKQQQQKKLRYTRDTPLVGNDLLVGVLQVFP